ncbi:uncharacterized protein LOC129315666 [Prosopis cineraria]|uniref:uncharacterized protein LOC129315666 n=1 Tax=Prosopis cineraria TaxID=364024 RepID=UPI002410287C|nr:uncharacterized protein LOC129315666 [Prosopis cineraria]
MSELYVWAISLTLIYPSPWSSLIRSAVISIANLKSERISIAVARDSSMDLPYHHLLCRTFSWDPEKKCVTAPKTVWDEYVKVNKKAAKWRNKTFPHYDELSNIFGKDRANGKDAQTYEDIVKEFHDQHGFTSPIEDTPIEHILTESQMDGSHANTSPQENSPIELSPFDATSGAKKRKRNSTEAQPSMLEGMKMIVQTLADGLCEHHILSEFRLVATVGSSAPITANVFSAFLRFNHSSKSTAKLPTRDPLATFQAPTKILKWAKTKRLGKCSRSQLLVLFVPYSGHMVQSIQATPMMRGKVTSKLLELCHTKGVSDVV